MVQNYPIGINLLLILYQQKFKKSKTVEELDQGSLYPLIKHPKTDMSWPRMESQPPASGGHSTRELSYIH